MIDEGSAAPDSTLVSDSGEKVTLELHGSPVVLCFYPKGRHAHYRSQ